MDTVNILKKGAEGDKVTRLVLYLRQYGYLPNSSTEYGNLVPFVNENSNVGYDFVGISIHELGHVLGLGHHPNEDQIMYPYFKINTVKRRLSVWDINLIRQLYPDAELEK